LGNDVLRFLLWIIRAKGESFFLGLVGVGSFVITIRDVERLRKPEFADLY
jgi:hypothetical protein